MAKKPFKNYECSCGETSPEKFYTTYRNICKKCKSNRTMQSYTHKKEPKTMEKIVNFIEKEPDPKKDIEKGSENFTEVLMENFRENIHNVSGNLIMMAKDDTLRGSKLVNKILDELDGYIRKVARDTYCRFTL